MAAGSKTFEELRAWVYEQLTPNEKQDVLLAAGVGVGPAAQVAQHGGPAEFWSKLSAMVEFSADSIDASLWLKHPLIADEIAAYLEHLH